MLGMQREGQGWVGDSSDFCQQRGKGLSLLFNSVAIPDSLCLVSCKGLRVGGGVGAGELNIAKNAVGMQQSLQEQAEMFQELLLRPFIVKIAAHMSAPGHTDAAFRAPLNAGICSCSCLLVHFAAVTRSGEQGGEGMHAPGGTAAPSLGLGLALGLFCVVFPRRLRSRWPSTASLAGRT